MTVVVLDPVKRSRPARLADSFSTKDGGAECLDEDENENVVLGPKKEEAPPLESGS